MLDITEEGIKNGQSRDTGKHWEYKTQDEDEQNTYKNRGWTHVLAKGKHLKEVFLTLQNNLFQFMCSRTVQRS